MKGFDMPEHYTSNTTAVLRYCPTCNRKTMHRVYNKRIGCCLENHVKAKSPAKPSQETNLELF